MKISAIVPVYNVEKYLDECIASICSQTYSDIEIVLIDDGSTDNSGTICDNWKNKDSRIVVVHCDNKGVSAARNIGLDIATGDVIAFVDSDDILEKNMYEDMIEAMTRSNLSLVVCGYKKIDENGKELPEQYDDIEKGLYTPEQYLNLFYVNGKVRTSLVVAWNKLYKKTLFENIRYMEGNIQEDEEIIHKLVLKTENILYLGKELYRYRIRTGSIMRSLEFNKNLYYYFQQRFDDCKKCGFSDSVLAKIGNECINTGIRLWLHVALNSNVYATETRALYKDVRTFITGNDVRKIPRKSAKVILFCHFPRFLLFIFKVNLLTRR